MESNRSKLSDSEEQDLFSKLELSYDRSQKDVWESLKQVIDKPQQRKPKVIPLSWPYWSAAASVVLVIGTILVARFYEVQVVVPMGSNAEHILPDGSRIYINADSKLSYAPWWWKARRDIYLEGEAFFEVEKGKKFKVISPLGTTEVLGTSFNIYARENNYEVFCQSGKVKVSAGTGHKVIIPGQAVSLGISGELNALSNEKKDEILSWRINKFVYNTTPLAKVFEDLERHYDIKIETEIPNLQDLHYTGLFKRSKKAKRALTIICHSFELQFEQRGNRSYLVTDKK